MKLSLIFLFISASLLVGCGDSTPKCNSDDAKKLVTDISQKQLIKQLEQIRNSQVSGFLSNDAESIQLGLMNVITIKHDSSLDAYTCSADLKMTLPGKSTQIPITYNIQKTDANDGQFYINAFGL
jgi:uncharacterized protein YcfL